MRIRRPRGITYMQLMVVTAVGFISGVYIWKPLFLKFKSKPQSLPAADLKNNGSDQNPK